MPTARQNQYLSQLTSVLGGIAQINPASLVRKEHLGVELCFEVGLPLFIDITSAAAQLQRTDLTKIPYTHLNQLVNAFQGIRQILDQIANFSPSQHGNPVQGRNSLINSLEDQWGTAYQYVGTVLASRDDDSSIRKELDVLRSQIATTMQLSSDALAALAAKRQEMEDSLTAFLAEKSSEFERAGKEKLALVHSALDEVRGAAAEAGVSQTSKHFSQEAREHLVASRWWLGAVAVLAIALLVFSIFGSSILAAVGVTEPTPGGNEFLVVKYLAQKGLVVFCLTFALIWSVKNHGASKHNYVVNKHRSNALSSFQAFATSAADDQTKSAVLIQATQSIFAPQPSGYVKTDGDNSTGGPVIEILRSVGASRDK